MYAILNKVWIRKILELMCKILGVLNKILPKFKNRVLFFDSKEVYLNNYTLFQYMIDKGYNKKYKIYFSMPGIEKYSKKVENVKYVKGLIKTMFYFLTSKYCFVDTGSMRIKPSKKQVVFNLWHGTTLKCIGFMSKTAEKSLPKNMFNSFTYVSVPSPNYKEIYKKSFNIKEQQIKICSQPRIDLLMATSENYLSKIGIDAKKYKKVVMWMTTYRCSYDGRLNHTSKSEWSKTNLPLIVDMQKIEQLNEFIKEREILLIIKIHHGSVFDQNSIKNLSNIKLIQDEDYIKENVQLYSILSECDALITDYSSVYYDYLMLDKPIGFVVDDIEDYGKMNGFVFENPLEYMPGEKIVNMEELSSFFEKLYTRKR